jgi:hypothetical protein
MICSERAAIGLSGVLGVALTLSFIINTGPPENPTSAELIRFGQQNYTKILWGAWVVPF